MLFFLISALFLERESASFPRPNFFGNMSISNNFTSFFKFTTDLSIKRKYENMRLKALTQTIKNALDIIDIIIHAITTNRDDEIES